MWEVPSKREHCRQPVPTHFHAEKGHVRSGYLGVCHQTKTASTPAARCVSQPPHEVSGVEWMPNRYDACRRTPQMLLSLGQKAKAGAEPGQTPLFSQETIPYKKRRH